MPETAARVLIVDDNTNLCKTLNDILMIKGFQPQSFGLGAPAITWAKQENPHVALIDLRLGDLPGLEVMENIMAVSPRTECIVLTGHASQESAIKAINLGAYAYFRKPFEFDQLLASIQHAIEKREATIALHESEERFRRLAENAQDLIYRYECEPQPGFTYMSPATQNITGYTPDAFYSDPELLFKMTYSDDRQLFVEMAQGGETVHSLVVLRWLRKDGALIWVELRNVPIYDVEGNLIAIEGIARDITDRMQAEENLKESQKKYQLLAENVSDVIWVVNVETERFSYVSPSVLYLLGYMSDEILNHSMEDILTPDSFTYLQAVMSTRHKEFLQHESITYVDEIQHHRKDGTKVWAEATMRFVVNEDSGQLEIYGVSRDITERKHARDMLEKRLAQLLLLNDVGGQLSVELDVNRVLDLAVYLVQETFNYFHVGLFTVSEEGDELILRAKAGASDDLTPGKHRLRIGQGIVGWVSAHGVTLLSNDVQSEPRYVNLYPHLIQTQSELSVPIRIGNQILGVLDIQSPDRNIFDDNDVIVMETLANQIAVAFENARLYQAVKEELTERKRVEAMLRERVERLRNLHEIDQAILAAQSPSEIAGIVLMDIKRLIPNDHASIVLFGGEDSYLVESDAKIIVYHNEDQSLDPTWEARLKLGKEIIIDDLLIQEPELFLPVLQNVRGRGIRSYLSIPLLVQEELIGIINLASFNTHLFKPAHAEIVGEMAVQVAIAIRQSQLLGQIQRHADELEQRVAERTDELRQANAALTRVSRMKDEFLASMSHELRTPLTGVLNLSEALQEQVYGELNEKQLKSLQMIEESGRHLLGLINDILDLSKIEAGQLELQIDNCSVSSVCQSSLQMIKGLAQRKHQNVSYNIKPASIDLQADVRRLKQMLVNLLSNAVKFTPNNGSIGLSVEGDMEAQVVRFTVWDEGIGISDEDFPKLFHAFTQLDSRLSRQQPGTGLGLALVQRMADLHGGSVSVESALGKGSCFTITLPWNRVEEALLSSQDIKSIALPLLEVLTVEDKGTDAAHLTRLLAELSITNIVHSYGEGVVDLAAHMHPGVILLDIYLPDKLGWDVLSELKADTRTSKIPVVITSIEEDRVRANTLGAVGYLVKPFTLSSLRDELSIATVKSGFQSAPVLVVGQVSTGPLILLAEDNEANISIYVDYLQANKYRVVVARHGGEAVTLAQEVQPNLILMDIQMPGMDGLEAIQKIRSSMDASIAAIPIIALTALAMPGDRERCLAMGANEYLSKPVRLQELIRVIQAQKI